MSDALLELAFWIVVFIAFFFGFKWLQNRKKSDATKKAAQPDPAVNRGHTTTKDGVSPDRDADR